MRLAFGLPYSHMREREADGLIRLCLAAFGAAGLFLLAAAALALPGHFRSGLARFGKPDGDRLFTAGDLLAGSAAAKRSALPLAHYLFDLFGRLSAVLSTATLLRHHLLLSVIWPCCLASAYPLPLAPYGAPPRACR